MNFQLPPIAIGACFMIAMALCFALGAALVREASLTIDHSLVVFFRYLIGLFFLLPILVLPGKSKEPLTTTLFSSQAWSWHLARSLFGFGAMYCYFYTLAHIPLAEAVLFIYAAPVFVPALAHILLKEHINRRAIYAAVIGLIGLLFLANPSRTDLSHAHFSGLLSTLLGAAAFVSVRRLSLTDPAIRTVFLFTLLGTVLAVLTSSQSIIESAHQLTSRDYSLLIGTGLVTTLAQWMMSKGYSYGPASVLAPFSYFTIVFGGILGWIIWQERPSLAFLAGTLLVLSAAAINIKTKATQREKNHATG